MQTLTHYANGTLILRLLGELDHCAAAIAMHAAEEAVEEYLPRQLVLDLSGLGFMDSSGIAVILKADKLVRQIGGALSVTGPSDQVRRVLEIAGLAGMLQSNAEQRKECELI